MEEGDVVAARVLGSELWSFLANHSEDVMKEPEKLERGFRILQSAHAQ